MGIYFVYLSVFNYLADTYGRYASSAIAAQSFCELPSLPTARPLTVIQGRNIFGGVLPLVNNIMFRKLSYQGASSFLGGVGFVLTLVPWVLVFYGPRIRGRSRFASGVRTFRSTLIVPLTIYGFMFSFPLLFQKVSLAW
jgi:hypothetical protein